MQFRNPRADRSGFTMVEIMIVAGLIGMLAVIAIPHFMKSRAQAQKQACIENLAQIESAKQIWGVENSKTTGDVPGVSDLIGPDSYIKKMPVCPAEGVYDFQPIGVNATCTTSGHTL